MSYFVVMQNYEFPDRSSQEATVNPKRDRNQILKDIVDGQYEGLAYIHAVDAKAGIVEDVTKELLAEAISIAQHEGRTLNEEMFDLAQSLGVIAIGYVALEEGRLVPYEPEPERKHTFDMVEFAHSSLANLNRFTARHYGVRS